MTDSTPRTAAEPIPSAGRRLQVRHLTRFRYLGPVTDSFNEVRLQPLSDDRQACVAFVLRLSPAAPSRAYRDFHGNQVHYFEVQKPHEQLDVEAVSTVETRPEHRPPLDPVHLAALDDPALGIDHFGFLGPTPFVPLDPPLGDEARRVLSGDVRDIWADAVRLGEHVNTALVYAPHATSVGTTAMEVLRLRRGVCQDYAHLMLGLCRSAGLPCRYVSGYVFNPTRPAGEPEASHAWVEVFLPGWGWRGYDPTHRREPDVNYIKLALGRDYADIRPVGGTYRGLGTREMTVEVVVRPVGKEG